MGAIFFCRVANFNALGIIEDSCLEVHTAYGGLYVLSNKDMVGL